MKIYRNSLHPWYSFLMGLASIIDGLVSVLTLGFYGSSLTFHVCAWATLKGIKYEILRKSLQETHDGNQKAE